METSFERAQAFVVAGNGDLFPGRVAEGPPVAAVAEGIAAGDYVHFAVGVNSLGDEGEGGVNAGNFGRVAPALDHDGRFPVAAESDGLNRRAAHCGAEYLDRSPTLLDEARDVVAGSYFAKIRHSGLRSFVPGQSLREMLTDRGPLINFESLE
jgi:hypothetical protein